MDAKQNGLVERVPCLGEICAGLTRRDRAPGAPWLSTLPALLAALIFIVLASGVALAVFYDPHNAYDSLQAIAREVNAGWLIISYHAIGTSLALAVLYLHLFRTLLVRGYRAPGELSWMLWVKMLAVLLLTGWLGFVLNGGAGGYWSLFNATSAAVSLSSFPGAVAMWFFGGPAGGGTLARILVFHVLLALCAVLIIWLAHTAARPGRRVAEGQGVSFWPVYAAQYFAALSVVALIFAVLLGFAPHWGLGAQNAIPAEALAVPARISYPWYLAPVAGLSGVFPGVAGHIWAVIAAAAVLYAVPWLDRSNGARPGRLYCALTWLLGLDVLALGIVTACPAGAMLPALFSFWFFFHFLVLTPVVTSMEAA